MFRVQVISKKFNFSLKTCKRRNSYGELFIRDVQCNQHDTEKA